MLSNKIMLGNAPCSWGILEYDDCQMVPYNIMLDELTSIGYIGTELGDLGYMPMNYTKLINEIKKRGLQVIGAFVSYDLSNPKSYTEGRYYATRIASLLSLFKYQKTKPHIVLSDAVVNETRIKNSGRQQTKMSVTRCTYLMSEVKYIKTVLNETYGLNTVFHPHCGSFIETPREIEKLLELTDIDLVFDTGHFILGSGNRYDIIDFLNKYKNRIYTYHFKDCSEEILNNLNDSNYFNLVNRGVFCELGKGVIDFEEILYWLESNDYIGWILVEQDIIKDNGNPYESAKNNFEYLINLNN